MTEYRSGGRRRIDRVLSPQFVEGLTDLSPQDLQGRQHEAQLEEADLSFARRLLQGRLDLLRSEQGRRSSGAHQGQDGPPKVRSDAEIVAALTRVLSDTGTRGPAEPHRSADVRPPEVDERRRAPELAANDVTTADLQGLDTAQLTEAVDRLEKLEHQVSASRSAVHRALDAVNSELDRRRYGNDAGQSGEGAGQHASVASPERSDPAG